MNHAKMWNVLRQMGIPEHLIVLMRNLYLGQEANVKTEHGETEWFPISKGVRQGCILSPYLFNLYAEYIMRKSGLDESPHGFKIGGLNINNLRYADDTTLVAESKEELEDIIMKVKEQSETMGLYLNINKTKLMTTGLPSNIMRDNKLITEVNSFCLLGSTISSSGSCSQEIRRSLALGRAAFKCLDNIVKCLYLCILKSEWFRH